MMQSLKHHLSIKTFKPNILRNIIIYPYKADNSLRNSLKISSFLDQTSVSTMMNHFSVCRLRNHMCFLTISLA